MSHELPVPIDPRDLGFVIDRTLTPDQTIQLFRSTQFYLRQYRLPVSFAEFRRVMPVIKKCVDDGLAAADQAIEPGVNLEKAFKTGFEVRRAVLVTAAKETQDSTVATGIGEFMGSLAIEKAVFLASRQESNPVTKPYISTPDIPASQKVAQIVGLRQPILNKLVAFARSEAEKVIPGASTFKLTPAQEAGLVRNMLFNLIAIGEPSPLLTIEDIVRNADRFQQNLPQAEDQLKQLRTDINLTEPEANKYLEQLLSQVTEHIKRVHIGKSISSLEDIENINRLLMPVFSVVNIFLSIVQISENPDAGEASIWDKTHTLNVSYGGETYEIPNPQVLRLLAYRLRAEGKPRNIELMRGADSIGKLFNEVSENQPMWDARRTDTESKVATLRKQIETATRDVKQGLVPKPLHLSDEKFQEAVDSQIQTIASERNVFSQISITMDDCVRVMDRMLEKYGGNQPFDETDIPNFNYLRIVPMAVASRVRSLLRTRIIERIQQYERVLALGNDEPVAEVFYERSKFHAYYEAAKTMTIVDVLAFRSKFWRDDALGAEGLSPRQLLELYSDYGLHEISSVNAQIRDYGLIGTWVSVKDDPTKIYDITKHFEHIKEPEMGQRLVARAQRAQRILGALEKGEMPADKPRDYELSNILDRNIGYREEIIRRALSVSAPKLQKNRSLDLPPSSEDSSWDSPSPARFGPKGHIGVIIRAFAYLAPRDMWPSSTSTLATLVHDPRSLMRWADRIETLPEDVNELQRFRIQIVDRLASFGYHWTLEQFEEVLPGGARLALRNHLFLADLFGLESEITSYLDGLEKRLHSQENSHHNFFDKQPKDYFRKKTAEARRLESTLEGITRRAHKVPEAIISDLRDLRLIKKVSTDPT